MPDTSVCIQGTEVSSPRLHFSGENHYKRAPGFFLQSEITDVTMSIQRATQQADINSGYFGVTTPRPECFWTPLQDLNGGWPKGPEILAFSPVKRAMTLTFVARVVTLSFKDDLGLPTPFIFSTFSPFYEADRVGLYAVLDIYSNLPEGYFPFYSMTADMRADRYLPDDSPYLSASFVPFQGLFDGRAGYFPPGSAETMPPLSTELLKPNDLAVYAVTVERYCIPEVDGKPRWTARLKLESITLLSHAVETAETPLFNVEGIPHVMM
ncbi:hypothetical protein BV25DRAFT_1838258 [Artomyces pyxidatus]|uniref:Uncharacterized protein n=1 Tax=Artomyces pyxidatus TaxID=48021 RepID=A0ACB8T2N1_9AGAM|nr:hypothetical protein BV25DRAFT_1838258 [Artomyces pyxidatus]